MKEENTKPELKKESVHKEEKSSIRDFFSVGEVGGYFFRKKDPARTKTRTTKAMHVINKIAILMFLICVIIILKRFFFGY